MNITVSPFGKTKDGVPVERYTLTDGAMSVSVLTYGGAIQSLIVPDRNGDPIDVALGFDTVAAYESQSCYIGALIGRFANRIEGGRFTLRDRVYQLAVNSAGVNHLHGGNTGFDKRVWSAAVDEGGLTLRYLSPAGEEGYPGTLAVSVSYRLENGALTLDYRAETDADTLVNLTNHSYFNLSGHTAGAVGAQTICVHADRYTPLGANSAPSGEIASVEGTPLDLRTPVPFSARWDDPFAQIKKAGGFDHNYILDGAGLCPAAEAHSDATGISLAVLTDMPGVQLYSGNFLRDDLPPGKGGARYAPRCGFCLETQFWPNAPLFGHFPQPVLRAGDTYRHTTIFHFSSAG